MSKMKESIWKIRGFLPYVVVVFLNAFTDLGHKIIIQNTVFKIYDGETQIILTAIVNALILLPFIMLFSPSGFISDRYSKSLVMRISAGLAVLITLVITASYYLGMFELAFAMTFLLALQSAIYSPAKYGYIKELVGSDYITMGNGVVQAVTTVAILGGILAYSIFFEDFLEGVSYHDSSEILQHIAPIGWALVIGSIIEFMLAYRLPDTHIECEKRFDFSRYIRMVYLKENLALLRKKEVIFVSILGLSLFWGISQVVLSTFPEYAKNSIGITNTVIVQGMMAIAGIGIVAGSIIAGKVSSRHIEIGTIPLGAIGITLSLFLLPMIDSPLLHACNFLLFGIASGLFIVPLNALIQYHSEAHELGMTLAGNNFMQNVVMVTFLGMTVLFALLGLGSVGLFYLMLLFAAAGTLYLLRKIPQSLVQFVILSLVSVRFRLEVLNFERLPQKGGLLLLGNHISWVDWALVQMAVPGRVRFVMDREIYERWYLKRFLDFFGVIPISARRMKQAVVDVEKLLAAGEIVCLFPEGTISRNGHLGSFKRGFEKMVGNSDAQIVPFYLRGLWGDPLSRSSARLKELRRKRRNDVIIAFGEPMPIQSRAEAVKQRIFELSCSSWKAYAESLPTLPEAWISTARRSPVGGGRHNYCMADWNGERLSHTVMLADTIHFSRIIRRSPARRVGLLLPAGSAAATIAMAVLMAGRELVPLDTAMEREGVLRVIEKSGIDLLCTASHLFGEIEGIERIDLEEMRASIGRAEAISTLVQAKIFPASLLGWLYLEKSSPDEVAVIHFTEGPEGVPEGVMLTQRNIMANITQLFDLLNVEEEDVLLSTLPPSDPLGLTAGILLPMIEGIPAACSPDPFNARGVGRTAARCEASIFFTTPSLLRHYTESPKLLPLMFASMRFVASGGGLDLAVGRAFEEKFKCDLFEGWSAAESVSFATLNLPDILEKVTFTVQRGSRAGTVGMPLPGSAVRIVDSESMETLPCGREGLLLVGGAQVMAGYLDDPERTDSVIIEEDGMRWYRTGDIGRIDEDGFLTLLSEMSSCL